MQESPYPKRSGPVPKRPQHPLAAIATAKGHGIAPTQISRLFVQLLHRGNLRPLRVPVPDGVDTE